MLLRIPEALLVTSFVYLGFEGRDPITQDNRHAKPIGVTKARIDTSTVYSRDTTQTTVVANGVIFCYADYTTPYLTFKEQSVIIYRDKEYVIQKVIEVLDIDSDRIWAYELEVL